MIIFIFPILGLVINTNAPLWADTLCLAVTVAAAVYALRAGTSQAMLRSTCVMLATAALPVTLVLLKTHGASQPHLIFLLAAVWLAWLAFLFMTTVEWPLRLPHQRGRAGR